ncbi:hypothetical protein GH714_006193 [Hevea brasiliensis]|uniref:MATH domain-containing protein n=1 Tax=Hevea brasiliensis TaxID=3981 RepID=A0A6A6LIJ2_HEVBR|nr:hypothetical protein GH714_006193 [Hevea brasiliensis]
MEESKATPFRFTWRINNFSKLTEKKLYSEVFCAGGCNWRLLIFPKGNNVDFLSIYLAVADSTSLPQGWSRDAKFSLAVVNQFNNTSTVRRDTKHVFNALEDDWGFTSFIPLSKVKNPAEGYLVADTLIVEAEVLVYSVQHYSRLDPKKGVASSETKLSEPVAAPPTKQDPPEARKSSPDVHTISKNISFGKTTDLDARLAQRQKKLSFLETEFSRLSKEEEKLEAQIQLLITQKEKIVANKKHVLADLEKNNEDATKDLEEWRNLESEIKQANVDWLGAKEKLALANVRWKLFKEDLGLGKLNIS